MNWIIQTCRLTPTNHVALGLVIALTNHVVALQPALVMLSPGLTRANTQECTFLLAVNSNVILTKLKLNIIVLSIVDISSMEHILNRTFGKIFIVKQQEIINECRMAFNLNNLSQIIKNRQLKFIAKLPVSNNIICRLISSIQSPYIIITICYYFVM